MLPITDLRVAPLCNTIPAEYVTTRGGCWISAAFQAKDAAGNSASGVGFILSTVRKTKEKTISNCVL